jgi:spermidine/putrescine transport system substrate-binding protein
MSERPLTREEVDLFMRMRPNSRRAFLAAFGAAAVGISLTGCKPAADAPAAAAAAKLEIPGSEGTKLEFYNWDTYIGPTTLADFKAASNIDVNMTLFANNDELFAKFRAGNPGFDLIMPSNEFVTRMVEAKMLMELDHTKIPNKKNLLPEFQDADFDPGRKYSMPYTWLVLGIGYRKSALKGVVPDSWKYIFDSAEYKGKISLLSESADLFRLGFKYLGKSVNGATPELIKQVEDMLIKQKGNIKNFHNDDGQDLLLSKEVDLVLEYNGDIAQKEGEDPDLSFVVPKEGSLINSDCMCIPMGAPNPNNAHAFINFLLDAQNGANITKEILYPTPNGAAKALMDESYKNNKTVYPPADIMAKCEYGKYEGSAITQAYEAAMTRVRAA